MNWAIFDPRYPPQQLSILAGMLSEDDPRPAREQLDTGYAQFGGWRPMQGFQRIGTKLLFPGDPPLAAWAVTALRNEVIMVYPGDWVAIIQADNTFEVCRMD